VLLEERADVLEELCVVVLWWWWRRRKEEREKVREKRSNRFELPAAAEGPPLRSAPRPRNLTKQTHQLLLHDGARRCGPSLQPWIERREATGRQRERPAEMKGDLRRQRRRRRRWATSTQRRRRERRSGALPPLPPVTAQMAACPPRCGGDGARGSHGD
jgi:hypothetical protein